ncbi:unnamed protein product [Onchocerca ochengi]|uniref:Transcriptional regulator n=2 Tax=Onchocerca ochengi TaxID=42157 RepID=A0A182E2H1_ONCOC|nr:unnamed protein product [Onchocerca ochengi]
MQTVRIMEQKLTILKWRVEYMEQSGRNTIYELIEYRLPLFFCASEPFVAILEAADGINSDYRSLKTKASSESIESA